MAGKNGANYLSEENRLEAQRRMLAERFGLGADDDDDEENMNEEKADEMEDRTVDQSESVKSVGQERNNSAIGESGGHGLAPVSSSEKEMHTTTSRPESRPLGVSSSALTNSDHIEPSGSGHGVKSLWPGVVLRNVGGKSSDRLPESYAYNGAEHAASTSKRECRVTQITLYNSIFQESSGRRIAVNDLLICYAVGGHIRVLARNSTQRILLKGHGSSVRDMEFALVTGNGGEASNAASGNLAVLGSVAEDGSVFVWKLARDISTAKAGDESNSHAVDGDDLDEDKSISLELVDSIRLDHPIEGRSYQSVSFRPSDGAILSSRGVGVALILLDEVSADLRLTELVKMGDKSMVLDKNLSGGHKSTHGDGLSAAAWVSNEIIATARGSEVCLWSATDLSCIVTLNRQTETESLVSSLHVLGRRLDTPTLLVASEKGRKLELWSIETLPYSASLKQVIDLYPADVPDIFNIVARDLADFDFVVVSNVKGKSLFVLHFNTDSRSFDALTEVPVKQAVMSLCLTKDLRQGTGSATRNMRDEASVEDLGIWCVQRRCIQKIHLSAQDCEAPKELLTLDPIQSVVLPQDEVERKSIISSSPTTTVTVKRETSAAAPSNSNAALPTVISRGTGKPAITLLKKPTGSSSKSQAAAPDEVDTSQADSSGVGAVQLPGKDAIANGSSDARGMNPCRTDVVDSHASSAPKCEAIPSDLSVSRPGIADGRGVSKPATLSPEALDEIVGAVVAAANKVVAVFDEEGIKRQAAEMARIDPLVKSVRETAESRMREYVSGALKLPMTDSIIPAVSEIVATASARVDAANAAAAAAAAPVAGISAEVSADWFTEVFQSSNIAPSFEKACEEMSRQAGAAVTESMGQKYQALVEPTISALEASAVEASSASKFFTGKAQEFMQQLTAFGTDVGGATAAPVLDDPHDKIVKYVNAGETREAFEYAVEKGRSDDVVWLCQQYDSESFFYEHSLTQICLLTLAKRLGQDMISDTMLKVIWLNEILLVLEPADDEIAARAPPTLQLILGNLEALRKDHGSCALPADFAKKSKGLSLLLSSLCN